MAKLRPHFYPFSCKQEKKVNADSDTIFTLEAHDPQPLAREGLRKLYGLTYRHLHRGSLKKLLSATSPIDMSINLPEIVEWGRKINALLSVHTIAISEEQLITCVLRHVDNQERVRVAVVTRQPRPAKD